MASSRVQTLLPAAADSQQNVEPEFSPRARNRKFPVDTPNTPTQLAIQSPSIPSRCANCDDLIDVQKRAAESGVNLEQRNLSLSGKRVAGFFLQVWDNVIEIIAALIATCAGYSLLSLSVPIMQMWWTALPGTAKRQSKARPDPTDGCYIRKI
ncbi:hypothetical protein GQ53DRAFT_126264 [Thozetella sp. PMI_491]|nr:hypothetical protein GQ53DRAFT_126264 [Thozetella sp. PMI_491]